MATPTPGESVDSRNAPTLTSLARQRAREHAAGLAVVKRERAYLRSALACGYTAEELADDLKITPRAIRHLLGPDDLSR